jgi:hypothetical protein
MLEWARKECKRIADKLGIKSVIYDEGSGTEFKLLEK